jgi:riboflavin synthase
VFTGIVVDIGEITELREIGADRRIHVRTRLVGDGNLQLGGSIAVNGVCLTITDLSPIGLNADVSAETLRCTTFANLQLNDTVNLEPAVTAGTALGGHIVSGHVDGVGSVAGIEAEGRSYRYTFTMPESLSRYLAAKGSVSVDGVSLTINKVHSRSFEVNIIPHTLEQTIFKHYQQGTAVNLEVDLLARYLERLLESRGG